MANQGKPPEGHAASAGSALARPHEQNQLDFEIDFFGHILERFPNFVDVLRVQGNNLTLKGRYADGLQIDKRLIHDGDYLAIGGFGSDRLPTAVLHEILRAKKQHLSLAGHTATHDFQILVAGNLMGRGKTVRRVEIAYVVGLEARGLSPHARRVLEAGDVEFTEWTNYALAVRFK